MDADHMNGRASTYRLARGAQVLALLLAVAIGLQGMPVHSLVQHAQSTHQECTHPEGYCPMNPDGPCRCNHEEPASDAPETPTVEDCHGPGATITAATGLLKWRPLRHVVPLSPRVSTISHSSVYSPLTSQRTGRDIFHPPRTQAPLRPVSTHQVADFA